MDKKQLLYEVDEFDKALRAYKNIEDLISEYEYYPYEFSKQGELIRTDGDYYIYYDEDVFLNFYKAFFDKINLNSKAEKISNSKYFNTIYYNYKEREAKRISEMDVFLQEVEKIPQKNSTPKIDNSTIDNESVILKFLREQIKENLHNNFVYKMFSKSNPKKTLNILIAQEANLDEWKMSTALCYIATMGCSVLFFEIYSVLADKRPLCVLGIFLGLSLLIVTLSTKKDKPVKLTEEELKELKTLPNDFKQAIYEHDEININEEFFKDPILSYVEPFYKDSLIFSFLKMKYTKKAKENNITNENG